MRHCIQFDFNDFARHAIFVPFYYAL